MPRAGARDLAKEQHWRQVIADQRASGLSVAAYCRLKEIRDSQFFDWQKTISKRDAEAPTTSRQRMAPRAKRITQAVKLERARAVEFAEVQIVDSQRKQAAHSAAATGTLEVVFPTGTKVRLTAGCSLELFASVINLLENR